MEEKRHGKMKSILLYGVFPFLIFMILGLFILNWLGFPVWTSVQAWGHNLPVVGKIIPDPDSEKKMDENDLEYWKQQYLASNANLEKESQKITALDNQIKSSKKDVEDLKKKNEVLQKQLEDKAGQQNKEQLKAVANIYADLPPSKASAMLEAMSLEDAAITISMLEQEQQSSILGKMKDAGKAARITMLLKEIGTLSDSDPTVVKDQLQEIVQYQEDPAAILAETIAGMPPVQAAELIKSMMGTNSGVAMNLMKKVSTKSRSQILTELARNDAKLAAQITINLEK